MQTGARPPGSVPEGRTNAPSRPAIPWSFAVDEALSRRIAAICTVQLPDGARRAQSFHERAASLYFLAWNCSRAFLRATAGAAPRGEDAIRESAGFGAGEGTEGAAAPPGVGLGSEG